MDLILANNRLYTDSANFALDKYDIILLGDNLYLTGYDDLSESVNLNYGSGTLNGDTFSSKSELFEKINNILKSTHTPINMEKYTSSWMFRRFGNFQTDVIIGNTEINLTPSLMVLDEIKDGDCPIFYDTANSVIKCKLDAVDFFRFSIVLRLNGVVSGGANTESTYEFRIKRPDGSLVAKQGYRKFQGISTTLTDEIVCNIPTRVFSGGSDRYITEGFRIYAQRVEGNQTMTLPAASVQNLFIER